ncbi:hypothetical protein A0H81_08266 [Grifola frondosa]|uniref:Uncharacterized protein n=1 Tax=Grifola frondosa TaxID=5627 RepID=A0A1C7M6C5_GRIFR|nr:hypothetical protein A0H81_08266 [Grifola frondosa]
MVQRDRLLALKKRSRGGGEPAPDGWDSWSGTAPTEWLHESQEFRFQKLSFTDLAVPLRTPLIFDELKMFHLLAMEYSWKGVSFTISWVQQMREFLAKQSTFEIPAFEEAAAEVPQFTGAFLDTAKALYSMPIPVDGEPVPAVVDNSDEFSWDDEPTPQFAYLPTKRPAVPLGDVRFLVFDLFGAIFDREQAIRNALQPLLEFKTCTFTLNDLFQLYITFESLRSRQHSASTIDLIRGALYDTTDHIGLIIGDEILATAINQISCPPLYPDANSTINTLHSRGFRLLCTSPIDTAASELMQSSLPPELEVLPTTHTPTAVHSPCPALYPTLLQYCDSKLPGAKADQVLVVTTSRFACWNRRRRRGSLQHGSTARNVRSQMCSGVLGWNRRLISTVWTTCASGLGRSWAIASYNGKDFDGGMVHKVGEGLDEEREGSLEVDKTGPCGPVELGYRYHLREVVYCDVARHDRQKRHLRRDDNPDNIVPAQPPSIHDQTIKLSFPSHGNGLPSPITITLAIDAAPGCGGIAWSAGEDVVEVLLLGEMHDDSGL